MGYFKKLKPFVLGLLVPFISIYLVSTHGSAEFQTSELKLLLAILHDPPVTLWRLSVFCGEKWSKIDHQNPSNSIQFQGPHRKTSILRIVPVVAHPSGHSFLLSEQSNWHWNTKHNRKVVTDGRTLGTYRST
jgi:hypothetical protein